METTEKKYRLPKEFAEKWMAALRSGEYKQGIGWLVSSEGYCCLGVAGTLCGIEKEDMRLKSVLETQEEFPEVPKELIGTAFSTNINFNQLIQTLVRMNDGSADVEKHSFPQIADWIEQNVEMY